MNSASIVSRQFRFFQQIVLKNSVQYYYIDFFKSGFPRPFFLTRVFTLPFSRSDLLMPVLPDIAEVGGESLHPLFQIALNESFGQEPMGQLQFVS